MASPSGNAAGALLASTTTGSMPVAGIELLLGVQSLVFAGQVPPSGAIALPLPFDSNLVGASIFFQSIHADPGGLAASNGLRMTVLQ
jgi:hypothetical protein